ncbi:hypothetical protein PP178_06025 [Zeaxanthinibacter sp. PT1]|uniref:hypothetical protein n=1 Tax=Zeaxanthinibacter TaxID=561554 RepID=UPI00234B4EEB|nr:hypothetical protein [Zeaxanthinibacter sp. PT1]MDC6351104.1 hypothetical protein [Zeaxanthinibacter sp. PT1]
MTKFRILCLLLLLLFSYSGNSQYKRESERRIKPSLFPENALELIAPQLTDVKRLRYYREQDSTKVSYELKFKKGRMFYSVEFSEDGQLEDIEILVKEVDIPGDSWETMQRYFKDNFTKFRIKKIQQQYPLLPGSTPQKTIRNAFQNLLIPELNYEMVISAKQERTYNEYEILFDASGNFISIRTSIPASYAHIIY